MCMHLYAHVGTPMHTCIRWTHIHEYTRTHNNTLHLRLSSVIFVLLHNVNPINTYQIIGPVQDRTPTTVRYNLTTRAQDSRLGRVNVKMNRIPSQE
jgi:hypothetical protein